MTDFFVLDTNVLLIALLFESSKPTHAYGKARLIGKICVSDSTLAEFLEVFLRKKFDKEKISFLHKFRHAILK